MRYAKVTDTRRETVRMPRVLLTHLIAESCLSDAQRPTVPEMARVRLPVPADPK